MVTWGEIVGICLICTACSFVGGWIGGKAVFYELKRIHEKKMKERRAWA